MYTPSISNRFRRCGHCGDGNSRRGNIVRRTFRSVDASSLKSNQSHLSRFIVDKLSKDGLVVIENVITERELKSARTAANLIRTEGRMQNASGNSITVRQDHVCFVRESDGTPEAVDKTSQEFALIGDGLTDCISLLRGTALELEKHGYTRSIHLKVPMQCQLAHYSGNGQNSYVAHRDAAADDNFFQVGLLGWLRGRDYRMRSVTAILYLNEADWNPAPEADGGYLKCYIGADSNDVTGASATSVLQVSPVGGTLVLFDSRYLLHEVEPSNRDRLALTLWIVGEKNDV